LYNKLWATLGIEQSRHMRTIVIEKIWFSMADIACMPGVELEVLSQTTAKGVNIVMTSPDYAANGLGCSLRQNRKIAYEPWHWACLSATT